MPRSPGLYWNDCAVVESNSDGDDEAMLSSSSSVASRLSLVATCSDSELNGCVCVHDVSVCVDCACECVQCTGQKS